MKREKQLRFGIGSGMAIGIAIGTAIGVATDNLGLWLPVSIAIGAGVGNSLMKKGSKKDDEDASNKSS